VAREESLNVLLCDREHPRLVGRLLDVGTGPHFDYDADFLAESLELAPLHLPLRSGVVTPGPRHQYRLRGLFADAIPDGFGLKVLHQALRRAGRDPFAATPLELLAAVGDRATGALAFRPAADVWGSAGELIGLAELAAQAAALDADSLLSLPDALRRVAGGSGGARPKFAVALHEDGRVRDASLPLAPGFRSVLIKLRASGDHAEHVALEQAYLEMARAAGLVIPQSELIAVHDGEQALVLDRFDREGDARRHVLTLAAMLEVDFQRDVVDYAHLLDATRRLTRDYGEVERGLRLAAFNVLAGNRDDHAKNVSFVMAPDGRWRRAPAYDLTWGGETAAGGYHAMSVDGESRAPTAEHVERIGLRVGLDRARVRDVIDEVRTAVARWSQFAEAAGVSARLRARVQHSLQALR